MNCQLVAEAVGARGPGWTWCPEEACQSSWPCSAGSGSWSRAAGRPVEGGPVQAGGTPASFGLHGGGQGSGHEGEISGAGEAGQTSSRPQGDTEGRRRQPTGTNSLYYFSWQSLEWGWLPFLETIGVPT